MIYIASLRAETGRRTQAQALRVIARILDADYDHLNCGALRYRHTASIRARITQVNSPSTANKIFSALRQTLKQVRVLGQMTKADYRRAIEMDPVTSETPPIRRELSTSEVRTLIHTCQKNKNDIEGTRDAAIIGIMYSAGLRRIEVVSLTMDSYNSETGKLIFTGKCDKQQTAYITNRAAEALNTWLPIRGNEPGALFVEVSKGEKGLTQHEELIVTRFSEISGGRLYNKKPGQNIYRTSKMTTQAIYNVLARRATEAGLRNFSPHDMRRTSILKTTLTQHVARLPLTAPPLCVSRIAMQQDGRDIAHNRTR